MAHLSARKAQKVATFCEKLGAKWGPVAHGGQAAPAGSGPHAGSSHPVGRRRRPPPNSNQSRRRGRATGATERRRGNFARFSRAASRTSATPSARLACAREAGGGDFKSAIRPRRLRISTQLRRIRNQRVRNCRKHGRHFLSIFSDFSRPCGAPSSAELESELPSRLGAGIRGIFEGFYRIWEDFRRI